ncbi:hypothetical protein BZA77DRAFT_111376 [Pyronema omphalodes]|nr:hypothetical protein BZA77DRAFT_111376 [Pyronema omphalodes]
MGILSWLWIAFCVIIGGFLFYNGFSLTLKGFREELPRSAIKFHNHPEEPADIAHNAELEMTVLHSLVANCSSGLLMIWGVLFVGAILPIGGHVLATMVTLVATWYLAHAVQLLEFTTGGLRARWPLPEEEEWVGSGEEE